MELFGPSGTLRQLLLAGERREGWRATLTVGRRNRPRLVSVTAAPFVPEPGAASPFPGLIGRSPSMDHVFRLIENREHSEATVLLTGESGTGKEVGLCRSSSSASCRSARSSA